ncbi:hypothetical protein FB451DRAFT_1454710 [Mycena latifolia]|nr:hypothetical protein FB451DRAFT_1454710 [Mycena latifolia]
MYYYRDMSRRWDNPSPVRQPSGISTSTDASGQPPSDPYEEDDDLVPSSPSDGRTNNPRKRPAEDMTQFAEQTARNLRLKVTGTQALRDYAQLTAPQQSLWLAGQLMLQTELLEGLQPPESIYHMPTALEGYIDQYSFVLLIDPKTSAYVAKGKGGPVERLTTFLIKHPDSGLTKIEDSFWDSTVEDPEDPAARPQDIVILCQQVLDLSANKQKDVKVSLEMCGRFAFLRESYSLQAKDLARRLAAKKETGKVTMDFWSGVDKDLKDMRAAKGNDEARISQCIADTLADDRKKYGPVSLEDLIQESPVSLR